MMVILELHSTLLAADVIVTLNSYKIIVIRIIFVAKVSFWIDKFSHSVSGELEQIQETSSYDYYIIIYFCSRADVTPNILYHYMAYGKW